MTEKGTTQEDPKIENTELEEGPTQGSPPEDKTQKGTESGFQANSDNLMTEKDYSHLTEMADLLADIVLKHVKADLPGIGAHEIVKLVKDTLDVSEFRPQIEIHF